MVYEGQELNHAFGLCHYKQFLFWNEYRGGSIYKLDQATKMVTLLRNERPPIFEIRVYDAHQQQGIVSPVLAYNDMMTSLIQQSKILMSRLFADISLCPCFVFVCRLQCVSS